MIKREVVVIWKRLFRNSNKLEKVLECDKGIVNSICWSDRVSILYYVAEKTSLYGIPVNHLATYVYSTPYFCLNWMVE